MPHRRGALAFLLITLLLSWPWWFLEHVVLGWSMVNPLVQLPTAFAPALAAIAVRRWVTREGFADATSAPRLRLRRAWRWYLAAWLGPFAITAGTLALAALLGLWRLDLAPLGAGAFLLPVVVLILAPVYWGEEFGWTGYLRPRLLPSHPMAGAVGTGLLWAVWHYPLAARGPPGRLTGRHPRPTSALWTAGASSTTPSSPATTTPTSPPAATTPTDPPRRRPTHSPHRRWAPARRRSGGARHR